MSYFSTSEIGAFLVRIKTSEEAVLSNSLLRIFISYSELLVSFMCLMRRRETTSLLKIGKIAFIFTMFFLSFENFIKRLTQSSINSTIFFYSSVNIETNER